MAKGELPAVAKWMIDRMTPRELLAAEAALMRLLKKELKDAEKGD